MRQVLFALLFIVAFLVVLLAGLVVVRREAAEMAISIALNDEGLSGASFQVTELDGDRARLEGLTLGRYGQVQAASVEVRFTGLAGWNPLAWTPEVTEIEIDGLKLRLTSLSASGLLDDPALDRLLNAPETEGEDDTPIPRLTFRDAEVTLTSSAGESVVRFDGSLHRPEAGPLDGLFRYRLEMPQASARGDVQLDQEPDQPMRVALTTDRARVSVKAGRISNLTASLTLTLGEDSLPSMEGEMTFEGIYPLVGYVDEASLTLKADPSQIDLDIEARNAEGRRVGEGSLEVTRLDGRPRVVGQVALDAAAASSQLGLTEGGGALTLAADLNATLPPLVELAGAGGKTPLQLLSAVALTSKLSVVADQIAIPGRAQGVAADFELQAEWQDGRLRAVLPSGGYVTIAKLDRRLPFFAGLPEDTLRALSNDLILSVPDSQAKSLEIVAKQDEEGLDASLAGPVSLRAGEDTRIALSGALQARLSQSLQPEELTLEDVELSLEGLPIDGTELTKLALQSSLQRTEGETKGSVALELLLAQAHLDDITVEGLHLILPLALDGGARAWALALEEGGRLEASAASLAGEAVLMAPASFELSEAEVTQDAEGVLNLHMVARSDSLRSDIPDDNLPLNLGDLAIELDATLDSLVMQGWVTLTAALLDLPSEGVKVRNIAIGLPLPPERLAETPGQVTIGSASATAMGETFSGVTADAQVTLEGETYWLRGQGRGPGGQGSVKVSLDHDMATHNGKVVVDWGPIRFSPDGLQPKRLTKVLADLQEVSGRLDVEVTANWKPGRSWETLRVRLADIAMILPPLQISGLNSDFRLREIWPLRTRPDQQVTIEELDAGVPLSDVLLAFQLKGSRRNPVLEAEDLQANFAGGRLTASPFQISQRNQAVETTIGVDSVDLAQLAAILEFGAVEMTGLVSGTIPLAIDPANGTPVITAGRLQTLGEGVLRIHNAAEMLGLGDISEQQRELLFALDALADFHYTSLSATLSFGANSELDLALTLEGNNPQVLDGHPFKFNVNVGIDLADLLNAIKRGQDITPALFEGGWTLK